MWSPKKKTPVFAKFEKRKNAGICKISVRKCRKKFTLFALFCAYREHCLVLISSVFPLTFQLIGQCPNFPQTAVPKALKECLHALNFAPIRYSSITNVTFPLICQIFQSYVYRIAKHYLPLFQKIDDLLKKISLVGTLDKFTTLCGRITFPIVSVAVRFKISMFHCFD